MFKHLVVLKNLHILSILLLFYSCNSDTGDPVPTLDCDSSDLELTLIATTNATSCSASDGTIDVDITGGVEPYQIQLRRNAIENTFIDGLSPGFYDIQVIDSNGCTDDLNILINADGSDLSIDEIITTTSGCNTANGSIEITANGIGLTYILDGVESTNNVFNQLSQGSYSIQVIDESGCKVSSDAEVLSGVSWSSQVETIIQTNCAINTCHDGSRASLPDYNVLSNVQNRADVIRSRTQSGNMPPAGRPDLSQDEIDLIACWVDDGALDN
ncbi:MAG: hypothetical protein RLO81_03120 [Fulvivirga sp.]|uniref:hypothetical protein n=1 Tax=Fulvivirga sp. TaxID=1931237 RepID=UPI0032EF8D30